MSTVKSDHKIETDNMVKRARAVFTEIRDALKTHKLGATVVESENFGDDEAIRLARYGSTLGFITCQIDGVEVEIRFKPISQTIRYEKVVQRYAVDVKARTGYYHTPIRIFEKEKKIDVQKIFTTIRKEVDQTLDNRKRSKELDARSKDAKALMAPLQLRLNHAGLTTEIKHQTSSSGLDKFAFSLTVNYLTIEEVERLVEFMEKR